MLIAYLTLDEVNADLALRLAAEGGAALCALVPREAPPGVPFDALLYDWDSLPAERREGVLAELLGGPLPCPVAVHGYNLDEGLGEELSHKGVAVYRQLGPEVFVQLQPPRKQSLRARGPATAGVGP